VIATLNSDGEDAAAKLKGQEVRVAGFVKGSKKAERGAIWSSS